MYFLLPNQQPVADIISSSGLRISNIMDVTSQWSAIYASAEAMIKQIFNPDNFSEISFWIFVYISLSIASHMELSPADLKGMMKGLITLVILLVLVNTVALLIGHDISSYIFYAGSFIGMFFGVYVYAIIVSLVNFILSFVFLSVYSLARGRGMINPFGLG
jgi:hypothetical protein